MSIVDLNVSPYYDDFDENDKYHRILFRPSFAVQARELTQVQSILQNQIKRSAQYFLEDGDYVVPGELIYDSNSRYVCLTKQWTITELSVEKIITSGVSDLSSLIGRQVGTAINTLDSENVSVDPSGVRGTILATSEFDSNALEPPTLFISYTKRGGSNLDIYDFIEDQYLYVYEDDGTLAIDSTTTKPILVGKISMGAVVNSSITSVVGGTSIARVKDGVYFVSGHMVKVTDQTIILDKYSNSPSYKIGLNISYEFIDEIDDANILDNATGAPNYLAPGSHRLKIDLVLGKKTLTNQDLKDFIELVRIDNGLIKTRIEFKEKPILKDSLSERTYDESGDYVVDSFDLETREYSDTLSDHNDRIGVFSASTTPEIVENEEKLAIGFDPGKAYVKGNKVKTFSKKYVPVQKARNLKTLTGSEIDLILADYGNYILVPSLDTGDIIVTAGNFIPGTEYTIVDLGNTSTINWQNAGIGAGNTPLVGMTFTALMSGGSGTGTASTSAETGWKSFNFSPYISTDSSGDPFLIVELCTENREVIGTARLKDIKKSTSTDVSVGYRIYLFDIELTAGREWTEVRSIIKGDVRDGTVSGIDSTQPIAQSHTIVTGSPEEDEYYHDKSGIYPDGVSTVLDFATAELYRDQGVTDRTSWTAEVQAFNTDANGNPIIGSVLADAGDNDPPSLANVDLTAQNWLLDDFVNSSGAVLDGSVAGSTIADPGGNGWIGGSASGDTHVKIPLGNIPITDTQIKVSFGPVTPGPSYLYVNMRSDYDGSNVHQFVATVGSTSEGTISNTNSVQLASQSNKSYEILFNLDIGARETYGLGINLYFYFAVGNSAITIPDIVVESGSWAEGDNYVSNLGVLHSLVGLVKQNDNAGYFPDGTVLTGSPAHAADTTGLTNYNNLAAYEAAGGDAWDYGDTYRVNDSHALYDSENTTTISTDHDPTEVFNWHFPSGGGTVSQTAFTDSGSHGNTNRVVYKQFNYPHFQDGFKYIIRFTLANGATPSTTFSLETNNGQYVGNLSTNIGTITSNQVELTANGAYEIIVDGGQDLEDVYRLVFNQNGATVEALSVSGFEVIAEVESTAITIQAEISQALTQGVLQTFIDVSTFDDFKTYALNTDTNYIFSHSNADGNQSITESSSGTGYGLTIDVRHADVGGWSFAIPETNSGYDTSNNIVLKLNNSSFVTSFTPTLHSDTLWQQIDIPNNSFHNIGSNSLIFPLGKTNIREVSGIEIDQVRTTFSATAETQADTSVTIVITLSGAQEIFPTDVLNDLILFNYTDGEIVTDIQATLSNSNAQMAIEKLDSAPSNTIIAGKIYYIICNIKKREVTDDITRKIKDLTFTNQQISTTEWINEKFILNKFDILDKNYKVFEKTATTTTNDYSGIEFATYDGLGVLTSGALQDLADGKLLDVTENYTIETGQTEEKYDLGSLKINNLVIPHRDVVIYYHYFNHTDQGGSASGDYFNVKSYPLGQDPAIKYYAEGHVEDYSVHGEEILFRYEDIPSVKNKEGIILKLSDCIDFRPTFGTSNVVQKFSHLPTQSLVTMNNIKFYLSRVDKIYLDQEGEFRVREGIPAEVEPPIPDDPRDGMTLCVIKLFPYTYTTEDVNVQFLQNRRYTMRDIGDLEKRVEQLEYYNSLSLLESSTSNYDLGTNTFKNGFYVDAFLGHNIGDTSDSEYKISIDSTNKELRPIYNMENLNIVESSGETILYLDEITNKNLRLSQDGIGHVQTFKPFDWTTTESFLNASVEIPHSQGYFNGILKLSPNSDDWKSLKSRPNITSNKQSLFDSVKNSKNDICQMTIWNEWEKHWTGVSSGNEFDETNLTIEQLSNNQFSANDYKSEKKDILGKTIVTNYVPFMRSKLISFSAYGLKPQTSHKIFIDDFDINSSFVTDANGEISGSFNIPNSDENSADIYKFKSGVRNIILKSVGIEDSIAYANYTAVGLLNDDIIDSIRIPDYVRDFNKSSLFQGFNLSKGLFLDKIKLFFHTVMNGSKVYLEIRTSSGGFPSDRIIPFSQIEKSLQTADAAGVTYDETDPDIIYVNGSTTATGDGTTGVDFEFINPVFLAPGEYVLVLHSNSKENRLYFDETSNRIPPIGYQVNGGLSILSGENQGPVDTSKYLCAEFFAKQFDTTSPKEINFNSDTIEDISLSTSSILSNVNSDTSLQIEYPNHGFSINEEVTISGVKGKVSVTVSTSDPSNEIAIDHNVTVGTVLTLQTSNGLFPSDYLVISLPSTSQLELFSLEPTIENATALYEFTNSGTTYRILNPVLGSNKYFNGVNTDVIHGTGNNVTAIDSDRFIITNSSFKFYLSGDGTNYNSSIEDSVVIEDVKMKADVIYNLIHTLIPSAITNDLSGHSTTIKWEREITTGSYEEIDVNSNLYFDTTKFIDNTDKLKLRATLSSTSSDWTPMIDTDRMSSILISNRVNNPLSVKNTLIDPSIEQNNVGKVRYMELIEDDNDNNYRASTTFETGTYATYRIINTSDVGGSPRSSGLKIKIPSDGIIIKQGDTGNIVKFEIIDPGLGYKENDIIALVNPTATVSDPQTTLLKVSDVLDEEEFYLDQYSVSSYITKQVQLNNSANSILIMIDGIFPGDSAIKVYGRTSLASVSDNLNNVPYRELPYKDNINSFTNLNTASATGNFIKDISYELNNINDFDLFNIKIVFESSDTTKISRIKNLRVIANTKT